MAKKEEVKTETKIEKKEEVAVTPGIRKLKTTQKFPGRG